MKKENKILVFLFLAALIIGVIFIYHNPVKIWDEAVYANLGHDLSKNIFHYSLKGAKWGDFIPSETSPYCWPNMGFRAPLLPYTLSIFYFLNLNFLINFFIPLIGALSVVLIYIFGRNLFNKKVALYAALFLMLLPLHTLNRGMILTGVYLTFFLLLTFFSFWKGYEKGNKKYKVLFGVFFAFALLTRYTALWIAPVFLLYFIIRDKSLKFLKDKHFWYSILAFLIVLVPWFIYGQLTYGNPLGAFIHGASAASYWGGVQQWFFFFEHWWSMFSIVGFVFVASLIYILYKKQYIKREVYLLLLWFFSFLALAIYMPHKEKRFILPLVPPLCILSAFFIDKIKKYRKILLIILIIILVLSNVWQFYTHYKDTYTGTNDCFLQANDFLKNIEKEVLVVTDESSVVYYYSKQQARFYPNPWSLETLYSYKSPEDEREEGDEKEKRAEKEIYVFFTDYDMPLNEEEHVAIKRDLDENLEKVFECNKDQGFSIIYKLD